jgi:signal transduction histidine kinase
VNEAIAAVSAIGLLIGAPWAAARWLEPRLQRGPAPAGPGPSAAQAQILLQERLRLERELEAKVTLRAQELARALRDLERTQQQLIRSAKMSLLGFLVRGVARELTGVVEGVQAAIPGLVADLAALQVALDLCRDAVGEAVRAELAPMEQTLRLEHVRSDVGALVDAIAEGARRATGITADLQRFARADVAERELADLHAAIDSTLGLLGRDLRARGIEVRFELDREIPPLECYPGPLNQVLLNLLMNAAQAIEGQGAIHIHTRRVEGERVEVTIRDNGKGIRPEDMPHLFEPFFTTKTQEGRSGTGLGLAISYSIVERHGGQISVESTLGEGTEFKVVLPLRAPGNPAPCRSDATEA